MQFSFEDFTLDTEAFQLKQAGRVIDIEPQVFDLLVLLVNNPTRLISKEEIIEDVWGGRVVSDATLSSRIKAARRAVGDDGTAQKVIQTVHGRGLRFLAQVDKREAATLETLHLGNQVEHLPTNVTKPSLVVLPFDNLSADPEQQYFSDGMVEAITTALSKVSSFFVIARSTAFTYKGKQFDVRDVGHDLGVAYALEGSVQRAGNRVRITAQLVETENGSNVWVQKFDGTLDDIFELQDSITEKVAGALQPSIQLAEVQRVRRKRPQEYGAYDYTMQALPLCWHLERPETVLALQHLDKALEIDPHYPLALSLKAWCLAQHAVYNWTENIEETKLDALQAVERAAGISGDDPLVLTVLGVVQSILRNYGTAKILLDKAVAIDPNSSWAWSRLGWLANYFDKPAEAIPYFERSIRLSPYDPLTFNTYVGIGSALEMAGRGKEAIPYYEKALQERPQATWIYRNYASALFATGDMDGARAAYSKLMQDLPDLTARKVREAMVFPPRFMDYLVGNLEQLGLPN